MVIRRNSPCPCGSGKKYRWCCEPKGKSPSRMKSEETQQKVTGQVSLAGLGGEEMTLTMLPIFKDPSDPRNVHEPIGRPGRYAVTFVMGRPGFSETQESN